jgi:hypothetical protein
MELNEQTFKEMKQARNLHSAILNLVRLAVIVADVQKRVTAIEKHLGLSEKTDEKE